MHTQVSPLYFDRVVKIIKQAKAREKLAMRQWAIAEDKNAPLWTDLDRLRKLVAYHERSLRLLSEERDALATRLDMIAATITPRG
jgi:hypothetical protein